MTHPEFQKLLGFQRAKHNCFKPAKKITSRFSAKRMSSKPQGRVLVELERQFIISKNSC